MNIIPQITIKRSNSIFQTNLPKIYSLTFHLSHAHS